MPRVIVRMYGAHRRLPKFSPLKAATVLPNQLLPKLKEMFESLLTKCKYMTALIPTSSSMDL